MTALKRLSKLKQFGNENDLTSFMKNEHRQNCLAIEQAFNNLTKLGLYLTASTLEVTNNSETKLNFSNSFGNKEMLVNGYITILKDGDYSLDLNLAALYTRHDQSLFLYCYINQTIYSTIVLASNANTSLMVSSPSYNFVKSLKKNDSIYYLLSSDSTDGAVTQNITWSSATLKVNEL